MNEDMNRVDKYGGEIIVITLLNSYCIADIFVCCVCCVCGDEAQNSYVDCIHTT